MDDLLSQMRDCRVCLGQLPHGCRPVLRAATSSKVVIIGQAPGSRVHASGIPWDDQSGKVLRKWMGVSEQIFYNQALFAIIPMGFCYPGTGRSGDLPPRKECAPMWHSKLLEKMPKVELILLIGQYAQRYYLSENVKKNMTETVRHFDHYLPKFLALPHPSPRNRFWLVKNPWFELDIVPYLQSRIEDLIGKE